MKYSGQKCGDQGNLEPLSKPPSLQVAFPFPSSIGKSTDPDRQPCGFGLKPLVVSFWSERTLRSFIRESPK